MKHTLAITAVVTLFLFANATLATTPTTEPALPSDIGTAWKKVDLRICTKHKGKVLEREAYWQLTPDSRRMIIVHTLNGQKVAQFEELRYMQRRKIAPTIIVYVKNTPGSNWLQYTADEHERDITTARFFAEIGLTKEQYESCRLHN